MPNWGEHLLIANRILKKIKLDENLFLFGNILPDVQDGFLVKGISNIQPHKINHYDFNSKNYKSNNKKEYEVFYEMYSEKMDNPIIIGYLAHLITDSLWNDIFYNGKCVKEKTGFDCIFQNRELMRVAWERKYGPNITGAMQISEFQQKQGKTMEKLYGGYTLASKELREKVDATVELLYGAKNIRNTQYYLELYETFKDDLYKNLKRLYLYDNQYFDSSWELAYYIWLKDNNIIFSYHPKPGITYFCNGKKHTYYPDFIVDNNIIEIKGDQFFVFYGNYITNDDLSMSKYKCMIDNHVILYRKTDVLKYLEYVYKKYGKNYLKSFKQF